jgi:hypothetical protein
MKFQVKVKSLISGKITTKCFSTIKEAERYADNRCNEFTKVTIDVKEEI